MFQTIEVSWRMGNLYWPHSHSAAFFVFFKTLIDPFYRFIYRNNPVREGVQVIDLGAGKCLFAGWQMAMRLMADAGRWSEELPIPPSVWGYSAIETNPRDTRVAAGLISDPTAVKVSDLLNAEWKPADLILLIDVMQYIPKDRHQSVLEQIFQNMKPGGLLLMRIGDESSTWRHGITLIADRIDALLRGTLNQPIANTRPVVQWQQLLSTTGFAFTEIPMNRGTPFSNTLFLATKS